jgi:CRP-like cAMP-binding protein
MQETPQQPKILTFEPGQVIFYEGEVGEKAYIVRKGGVKILSCYKEKEVVLAELKTGTCFGEMAIIGNMPRTASAVSMGYTDLYEIDKAYLDKLIASLPRLVQAIISALVKRMSLLNEVAIKKTAKTPPLLSLANLLILLHKSLAGTRNLTAEWVFEQAELIIGLDDKDIRILIDELISLRAIQVTDLVSEEVVSFDPSHMMRLVQQKLHVDKPIRLLDSVDFEYFDLMELAQELKIDYKKIIAAIASGRIAPEAIKLRRKNAVRFAKD